MPLNPHRRRCTFDTRHGRAYAVHRRSPSEDGSDPPACSTHAGLTSGAGASTTNQNARSHGLQPDELAVYSGDLTLDDEIACARLALPVPVALCRPPHPRAVPERRRCPPKEGGRERASLVA